MKILFSVKAFLNYLYNNLIDLIWVKKIRFEDGTEMSSLPVGANIYDIKKLSQAIIDKGWTYLCNSTKQMLPKAKIPTVYNDIEYKYLNCDKQLGALTDLLGNSYYYCLAIDDTYLYTTNSLSNTKLKRTRLANLPTLNFEDLGTSNNVSDDTELSTTAVGDKLLINGEKIDNYYTNIKIYKKSDMTVLKTIEHYAQGGNNKYAVSYIYVNGVKKFVIIYKNYGDTYMSICFVEDKETLQYENHLTTSYEIGLPTYVNGYYYFESLRKNDWQYLDFLRTTDFVTYETQKTLEWTGDRSIEPTYSTEDTIINGHGYRTNNYGATWTYDNSIYPLNIIWNSFFTDGTSYYFTTSENNSKILRTQNLSTFETVSSLGRRFEGGKVVLSNSKDMIFVQNLRYNNAYRVWYLGYENVVYTDTYTINGVTVNIQYYKNQDWKICISDGGTNDTNLDTVYNGLGYENYWLLDRNNEQLCLPRNSNLYTQMYVGDDYEDLTVPTGVWSAVATKNELDNIKLGGMITPYAIENLVDHSADPSDTVYQPLNVPQLVIIGSENRSGTRKIQVSTDGQNWVTVYGTNINYDDGRVDGDLNCFIVGSGLYIKYIENGSNGGTMYFKLAPLYAN